MSYYHLITRCYYHCSENTATGLMILGAPAKRSAYGTRQRSYFQTKYFYGVISGKGAQSVSQISEKFPRFFFQYPFLLRYLARRTVLTQYTGYSQTRFLKSTGFLFRHITNFKITKYYSFTKTQKIRDATYKNNTCKYVKNLISYG